MTGRADGRTAGSGGKTWKFVAAKVKEAAS